jgi:hypothetical protein
VIFPKKIKDKKCKWSKCLKPFTPVRFNQKTCNNYVCALGYSRENGSTKKLDNSPEKIKERVEKMKQEIKYTPGYYEAKLQTEVNEIIRIIDDQVNCRSCEGFGKAQAGHYHSRGKNTTLRFNGDKQCFKCNVKESANITGYNLGLIKHYGKPYQEFVEYQLPLKHPLIKWNKEILKECIKQAREFKRWLKKEVIGSNFDRMRMRDKMNEKIGLYE